MPGGLLAKAQAFTGPPEKPGLLHPALKASIDGASGLARLGGIASPPSPTWGVGDALQLPRRRWPGFARGVDAAFGTR
jgi:hypothetical protein